MTQKDPEARAGADTDTSHPDRELHAMEKSRPKRGTRLLC